ncbi:hypothetical protein [Amycolatopsis sp. WGS_07]|uniref:hypothetical protein n=1 Tax=Amycolatopsis sp. WGS_07 TaxID=3076764 RepID=UPI0038731A3A
MNEAAAASRTDVRWREGTMRTVAKRLTVTGVWLIAAGAASLGAGFIALITTPPDTGANIGAAGFFTLGLGATGLSLLLGVVAALARLLEMRGDQRPPVELMAWQKRLKRLTWASVGLITVGAVVLGWGTFIFANGHAGSGLRNAHPVFLAGLCIAGAGFLAGIPPILYWWSKRRAGTDL